MKYKAGDEVIINSMGRLIKNHHCEDMCEYAGQIMTIDYVGSNLYKMKEDEQRFIWRENDVVGLADDIIYK